MIKRLILITLLFFIVITAGNAQQHEKLQSLFIYNFAKYIKWPDSYNSGKFVIAVIGDSPIIKSITSMASSKKTRDGSSIEVKTYGSIDEIGDCNILFVSENVIGDLSQIDSIMPSKPILIVTAVPGMAEQGSVINFVTIDGKVKFELNASKATSRGLVVSSSLTSLAIVI
jgi:hypothetical protein